MMTRSFYSLAATLVLTGAIFSTGGTAMADETKAEPAPKSDAAPAKADAPAERPAAYAFPAKGTVPKLDEKGYNAMTSTHGSDLLVVNFWATWCGPCVAELPHFVAVSKENPESRVRFVGMSLDMANQVDSVVVPFLEKKEIPYANFLLDADDADSFIGAVSNDWSGAIPATFIYDRSGNKIFERLTEMSEEELHAAVETAKAKVPASAPAADAAATASGESASESAAATTNTTK